MAQASVEFFLKNELRLTAYQAATFGVLIAIPAYLGFAFGFLRDRWSPFGLGDRGYYLLFMPLSALGLFAFAFGELTYARLVVGGLFVILCGRIVSTAMAGALAATGQRRHLTGRLSSVVPLVGSLVRFAALAAGGWIAAHVAFSTLMIGLAISTLAFVPLGFWRPEGVFEPRPSAEVRKPGGWREVARLLGHRPLWPMLGIQLLSMITLADVTAFFYHFTDRLHATPQQVGISEAARVAGFGIGALVYALLCRRVSVSPFLLGTLLLSSAQYLPILFAPTAAWAIAGVF